MLSSMNGHQISVPVLLAPGSTLALSRRILLLEDISGDNDGKKLFSLEASLMEKIQVCMQLLICW
jgi:hypothetical protein